MSDRQASPPLTSLRERVRRDGSRPLLTYVATDGGRMELSATTTANWVAKLSWALEDAGVVPGDVVAMPVLRTRSTHWLPLVWGLGAWAAGATIAVDAPAAEVGVAGPDTPAAFPVTFTAGGDLWGRDSGDVLAQPDAWRAEPIDLDAVAVEQPARRHRDLAVRADQERRVVLPAGPADALLDLAAALIGGGSLVLLDQEPTAAALARIADQERATALPEPLG